MSQEVAWQSGRWDRCIRHPPVSLEEVGNIRSRADERLSVGCWRDADHGVHVDALGRKVEGALGSREEVHVVSGLYSIVADDVVAVLRLEPSCAWLHAEDGGLVAGTFSLERRHGGHVLHGHVAALTVAVIQHDICIVQLGPERVATAHGELQRRCGGCGCCSGSDGGRSRSR